MRLPALAVVVVLAAPLLPAAADARVERRAATPRSGGERTTFAVRYRSSGADGYSGDQVYLRGPRRTGCRGLIVLSPAGFLPGTQTLRFGFGRERDGGRRFHMRPSRLDDRPLARWCPGYYRGEVRYEGGDPYASVLVARFFFVVR